MVVLESRNIIDSYDDLLFWAGGVAEMVLFVCAVVDEMIVSWMELGLLTYIRTGYRDTLEPEVFSRRQIEWYLEQTNDYPVRPTPNTNP